MDELTPAQLTALVLNLEALIRELEHTLASSRDASKTTAVDQGQVGRLTRMDAIQQQKMVQANRRRISARLHLALAARNLVEVGEYGLCKRCEEPIGYPRLQARPDAPLCLECKSATERG